MTSRNLYFKLMLEDLKRRVWTIALTLLSMMFSILVPVAIKCSEYSDKISNWNASTIKRMTNNIVSLLGVNGLAIFFLLAAAVLWAVSGFQYLHNSKKVDFYHSIPVKRHVLFITRYLNGILVPAISYLLFLVPSVILAYNTGIDPEAIGMIPWQMFGINMVYYSLCYTVTIIAMMMTGNIVVALLGTGVFCGYVPAVVWLVRAYYSLWFHTYYETEEGMEAFYKVIKYSSPISNYMYTITDFMEEKPVAGATVGAAVVTVVLAVAAYLLYRIRSSESAGKAMAFKKTRMPIKVLIVIPLALASGMIFYELRDTIAWLIFGTVCGVILVHCVMEIIYHFDFRRLFHNKLHLAVCMAVSVLLALAGYYDWYGYDSWLPDGEDIQDAAIVLSYQDNWVTYGHPSEPNESSGYIYWEYEDATKYSFDHMKLTDIYPVLEVARRGVEADVELREKIESTETRKSFIVQYHMEDGKAMTRRYSIPMDEEMWEIFDTIHDSGEYKTGTYPIMGQTAADTVMVNFQQYDQVESVELSYDEMAHLLDVYKTEWKELTMDTRRKELPIATIQFRTKEQQEAIEHNRKLERYSNDIGNRCYYPIYPSFTRTLEILEQKEIIPAQLGCDVISKIQLYHRDEYWTREYSSLELNGLEGKTLVYTDAADINVLAPALVYQDYYNMNTFYEMDSVDNVDISAVFRSENEQNDGIEQWDESYYGFYIDAGCLTEEQMKQYGLQNVDLDEGKEDLEETVVIEATAAWY